MAVGDLVKLFSLGGLQARRNADGSATLLTEGAAAGASPVAAVAATIPNAGNQSGAIDLGAGKTLGTIHVPAGFTGGYLEFDVAPAAGGAYTAMKDSTGAAIRYNAAAGTTVKVQTDHFLNVQFLKLRSTDASGNASNQGADRAFSLAVA